MAVMRVCAVATLVVSFNFFAAFFTLKRWHNSSQQDTTANNNNFAREGLHIKAAVSMALTELKTISDEAKAYSKRLLTAGNLAIVLWILIDAVACWFFNPIIGWVFLIAAFALIFVILRRLGCSSCYYCKSCTMGFGKLADLFFGQGYMAGVNSSLTLKIIFVYGLLGLVPIAFLAVSIIQEFAVTKIAVLALLLIFLSYSGSRRKPK
jgi:hypothetical protein